MTTYSNVSKTPLAAEKLNAVVQDAQNRIFMDGNNKIFRDESSNPWSNVSKTT
jgi:hypothetical protein